MYFVTTSDHECPILTVFKEARQENQCSSAIRHTYIHTSRQYTLSNPEIYRNKREALIRIYSQMNGVRDTVKNRSLPACLINTYTPVDLDTHSVEWL